VITSPSQQAKCFGYALYGTLGYEDVVDRGSTANTMGDYLPLVNLEPGLHPISIRAGISYVCSQLSNLQLKCWGYNSNGQLGYGDINNRGDSPNTMGNYLPSISLGSNFILQSFSSGGWQSIVLSDDGKVKSWGRNNKGQLGYGDITDRGDSANQMGNYLPFINLGTGRTAMSVWSMYWTSCAFLDDLSMKCWGDNAGGYLGYGDTFDRGDDLNEMSEMLTNN